MAGRSDPQQPLRRHLLYLLRGGGAHLSFDKAIAGLPARARGRRPARLPHSPWEILEHLRLAQWDILEFSRNPKHVSPDWPEGYWPKSATPPRPAAWEKSVRRFRADLKAMERLVAARGTDLFARSPRRRPDRPAGGLAAGRP